MGSAKSLSARSGAALSNDLDEVDPAVWLLSRSWKIVMAEVVHAKIPHAATRTKANIFTKLRESQPLRLGAFVGVLRPYIPCELSGTAAKSFLRPFGEVGLQIGSSHRMRAVVKNAVIRSV